MTQAYYVLTWITVKIRLTCAVFQQSGSFANILSTCNSTVEFPPNICCTGEHYLSSDLESKAQ